MDEYNSRAETFFSDYGYYFKQHPKHVINRIKHQYLNDNGQNSVKAYLSKDSDGRETWKLETIKDISFELDIVGNVFVDIPKGEVLRVVLFDEDSADEIKIALGYDYKNVYYPIWNSEKLNRRRELRYNRDSIFKKSDSFRKNLHKPNLPNESEEVDEAQHRDDGSVLVSFTIPTEKGVSQVQFRKSATEFLDWMAKIDEEEKKQDILLDLSQKDETSFELSKPITINIKSL